VTIGRALHWMDRDRVAVLWERLVASDGTILVCSSNSATDGRNPWLDEYNKARRFWSESSAGERYHRQLGAVLQGTQFHVTDAITIETSRQISVSDLARRVLTFSSSSPAVLGTDAARCSTAPPTPELRRLRHRGRRVDGAGGEAIGKGSAEDIIRLPAFGPSYLKVRLPHLEPRGEQILADTGARRAGTRW